MMPTASKYGGWPACGEIDIMELRGDQMNKVGGTLHFGDPWKHIGGSYYLPSGSFNDVIMSSSWSGKREYSVGMSTDSCIRPGTILNGILREPIKILILMRRLTKISTCKSTQRRVGRTRLIPAFNIRMIPYSPNPCILIMSGFINAGLRDRTGSAPSARLRRRTSAVSREWRRKAAAIPGVDRISATFKTVTM